ncbi:MAG: MFS transporter [Pseudomonadales bacterium]
MACDSTIDKMVEEPRFLYRPILLASASFGMLSILLPIYARQLGASATAIGGLFSVFTGIILVVRPLTGWALDHYGRRPFLLLALASYVVCMVVFGQSIDLPGLYAGRILQGVGAAAMWLTLRTVVADTVPEERRARIMGRLTEQGARGSMFGAFFGFTLIGFLPLASAWRWSFLGYAVLSAIALILSWHGTPETKAAGQPGLVPPWDNRGIALSALVATVALAEALIGPVFLILLTDRFELEPAMLGTVMAGGILYAFVPSRAGAWGDRIGRYRVVVFGLVLAALVNGSFPFLPSVWVLILVYTVLVGAWCMVTPQLDALITSQTTALNRGRTVARYEFVRGVGAACGPLLGGWLYDEWHVAAPFITNSSLLLSTAVITAALLFYSRTKQVT